MDVIGQNGNDGLHYEEPKKKKKIVEVPVEVEKIIEKEVIIYKDNPILNHPKIREAIKHAKRSGKL